MRNRYPGLPWVVCGLLGALTACVESDLLGPGAAQGIDGIVLLGPQCPVQTLEDPCPDLPYQAWIEIRGQDGRLVTRIRSTEDGRFRTGLRPGSYVLDPESGNPFPVGNPVGVEVEKGAYTPVTISLDTGIR